MILCWGNWHFRTIFLPFSEFKPSQIVSQRPTTSLTKLQHTLQLETVVECTFTSVLCHNALQPVEGYRVPIFDPNTDRPLIGEEAKDDVIGDEALNRLSIGDKPKLDKPKVEGPAATMNQLLMSSVLKKRKTKMNKHKYRKRMRKNRALRMNEENAKALKIKRQKRAEERIQKALEKKQKQRELSKSRSFEQS